MSKAGRSLRFTSPDAMPPSMAALFRQQEEDRKNRRLSRALEVVTGVDTSPDGDTSVTAIVGKDAMTVISVRQTRRNKYGAQVTYVDGIRFDSKREAKYYETLKLRVAVGEVLFFLRQVPFHLPGGTKLVVDFEVHEADGRVRYIDAKGRETAVFRLKKREVEHHYPVVIELA